MSEFLTVAIVARQLSVSRKRVYQLVQSGKLESMRPSPRRIRISRLSLEQFVCEQVRKEKMELGLDLPAVPKRRH